MYVFSFEVETDCDPNTLLDLTIQLVEGYDGLVSLIRDNGGKADFDEESVCITFKKEEK